MADEAILRTRFSNPVDFTCADGTGMLKGTIVFLSGARTVAPSAADNNPFGGVLARDKIAGDSRTQCAVFLDGIFDMRVFAGAAAITVGEQLSISGANRLKCYTTLDNETGLIVGRALEPLAAGDAVIQVLVGKG